MEKENYSGILAKLPIRNASEENIRLLCPHLSLDQAVEGFENGSGYVACPPLLVNSAIHIVMFKPSQLSRFCVARTKQLFSGEYGSKACQYISEAIEFAKVRWGTELISDNWQSVVTFYLLDPTDIIFGP
jgi:hypothetical protein